MIRALRLLVVAATLLVASCKLLGLGGDDEPVTKAEDDGPLARPLGASPICDTSATAPRLEYFADAAKAVAWAEEHRVSIDRSALGEDDAAVAVLVGRRSTGGYGVAVEPGGTATGGVLRLKVAWREPGSGMMLTQAITGPCAMAAIRGGPYRRIEVIDATGAVRAGLDLPKD